MKFLEVDSLDILNSAFEWETPECSLVGRVEAYSCKSAGSDKKLFKQLENRFTTVFSAGHASLSPDDVSIITPFGRLDDSASRKTFYYLLGTLNAAFPEHYFDGARPDQFTKQLSSSLVIRSVNTTLFNLGNVAIVNKYRLWEIIDELVELEDCDVYSYNPDVDDDPMSEVEGYLWSMNYFFYSRKLKRMVFFWVQSQRRSDAPSIGDDDDEEFEDGMDAVPIVMGDMEV